MLHFVKSVLSNRKKAAFGVVMGVMAVCMTLSAYASGEPGSQGDPLVSKSYVDAKIAELTAMVNDINVSPVEVAEDRIVDKVMESLDTLTAAGSQYVPVLASASQIVIGGEGTEIILRSGSAKAYVPGANGIVNATAGTEMFQNDIVPENNILIVPRDDGRGVTAVTDSWFIIKGSYVLIN